MRRDLEDVGALLFDFDGVIFDTSIAVGEAWRSGAKRIGRVLSDKCLEEHVYGRSGKDTLSRLFPDLGPADQARLHAYVDEAEETARCPAVPGVGDFLIAVADVGVPSALVTGSWGRKIDLLFGHSELIEPFLFRITRDDVDRGKPDPEPYLAAIARLGTSPRGERVVVFEDSVAGVSSACDAGCMCVGIGGNDERLTAKLLEAGASIVVPDFRHAAISKSGGSRWRLAFVPTPTASFAAGA